MSVSRTGFAKITFTATIFVVLATLMGSLKLDAQEAAAQSLTSNGMMRTALITEHSAIVKRYPDGHLEGLAVDVANVLANTISASAKPLAYDNIIHFNRSIGHHQWDIAIIPRDLSRVAELAFSQPLLRIELGYIARPASTLFSSDDVDRTGITVAVTEHSAADSYLSRSLTKAKLVRLSSGISEAKQALTFGKADVYADTVSVTHRLANEILGARMLVGYLSSVPIVFAVPKPRAQLVPFLNRFIETTKQSGHLAALIKQAGVLGVQSR